LSVSVSVPRFETVARILSAQIYRSIRVRRRRKQKFTV